MKIQYALLIFISFLIPLAHSTASETVTLDQVADIQDATTLNNAINALSERVADCLKHQLVPADSCYCPYPKELSEAKSAYDRILRNHPEWRDKIIFWWQDKSHRYSYNISLNGLRLQFEKPCPR